jgi:uncharacterized membrane protein (DUF485 family)
MIPFQGLVAEIFAVIGFIRFWRHPLPAIWWVLFVVFFAEWFLCQAFKKKWLRTRDLRSTMGLAIPVALLQLAEIGIGISSLF